jgi:ATP-binding cassette, subfamily F, member 2
VEWCVANRRYGLLGPNGCGKSTLLKAIGSRELPIPDHINIYFLDREMEASDMSALDAVMSVDEEKGRLEKEADQLSNQEGPEVEQRLEDIYERCAAHTSGPI